MGGAMELEHFYNKETKETSTRVLIVGEKSSVNHYYELGLVSEKTNMVIRICNELNFTIEKKKSSLSSKKMMSKGKMSNKKKQTNNIRNIVDEEFSNEIK